MIAALQEGGQTCIQVFFFRNDGNYGNRAYFPSHDKSAELPEVLAAFIGQFYENKQPPPLILVSQEPAECELLAEALTLRAGAQGRDPGAPARRQAQAAGSRAAQRQGGAGPPPRRNRHRSAAARGVAELFGLDQPPKRIEVYDNSHISGTNPYGAMIVAGPEGFMKNEYRKFTIRA